MRLPSAGRSTTTRSRTSSTSPPCSCRSAARTRSAARGSTSPAPSSSSTPSRRGSRASAGSRTRARGGLRRRRPLARPRVGRDCAVESLRGVQARERGHGARVLGRRRRRVDRHPPVRRVRPRPRPGAHVGADARDGGRRPRRGIHDRLRGTAQYDFAPDVGRAFALAGPRGDGRRPRREFSGGAVDDAGGRRRDRGGGARQSQVACSGKRASSRSRSRCRAALLERLIGPMTGTPLADGVRATVEHFRAGGEPRSPAAWPAHPDRS